MEIGDLILNGNREAWIPWRGDIEVGLRFLSPADDRDMLKKIQRAQFRGHQRMENEIDLVAMRDYFCEHVIIGVRGLTRDGQPFEPSKAELRQIWDGNHEFGLWCVNTSRDMDRFREEKKL